MITPDQRWLAAVGGQELIVWDLSKMGIAFVRPFDAPPRWVAVSPNSRYVAAGGISGHFAVFRLPSGDRIFERKLTDTVQSIAFSPVGTWLAVGDRGGAVRIWDYQDGFPDDLLPIRVWHAHEGRVYGVAFSNDGRQIASVGSDEKARIWRNWGESFLRSLHLDQTGLTPYASRVRDIAAVPGTHLLAAIHWGGPPRIWDLETGDQRLVFDTEKEGWVRLTVSPDGQRIAATTLDGHLCVWEVRTGQCVRQITPIGDEERTSGNTYLAFSLDNRHLIQMVRGNAPQELQVFEQATGQLLSFGKGLRCTAMAVAPRSEWLALGTTPDDSLALYSLASWKLVSILPSHDSTINDIAFSPDGRWIASASQDRKILLRRMDKLHQPHVLHGHRAPVRTIAFTPDSQTLVSGGEDGQVLLWNVATARLSLRLDPFGEAIDRIALTSDGAYLVVLQTADAGAHNPVIIETGLPSATSPSGDSAALSASRRREDR
ncbi:MAG: WD40 repeat domain-containing protein [Planctomycetes bacterium]|nr:WD40 repeat domain-containing protein [Planctomycetota bacterium]